MKSVDFPAPDWPEIATKSPFSMVRFISSKTLMLLPSTTKVLEILSRKFYSCLSISIGLSLVTLKLAIKMQIN